MKIKSEKLTALVQEKRCHTFTQIINEKEESERTSRKIRTSRILYFKWMFSTGRTEAPTGITYKVSVKNLH